MAATVSRHGVLTMMEFRFASGFPYPVPAYLLPINVFLTILNVILVGFLTKPIQDLVKERNRRGITGHLSTLWFAEFRRDIIYLVASTRESDFPIHVPPNVMGCGPILPRHNIDDIHPELRAWLAAKPTIIVNMGSHITQRVPKESDELLKALYETLRRHPDKQVLWKRPFTKEQRHDQGQEIPECLRARLRILPWLPVPPIAFLSSPSVVASVHHGGSNSFHEAVAAGVPQVVCPVWLDTYDFATRAAYLGIGVRGNARSAPEVRSAELADALDEVLSDDERAEGMRRTARELAGKVGGANEGRRRAAERVLEVSNAK